MVRTVAVPLLAVLASLSAGPVWAMKHVPAAPLFRTEIAGPSHARICQDSLWVLGLAKNTLYRLNSRSGKIESEHSLAVPSVPDRVLTIGCGPRGLLLGTAKHLYSWSAGLAVAMPIPGDGPIRDIHCQGGTCLVVRNFIWMSENSGKWSSVLIPASGTILPKDVPSEDDPFASWQDQFLMAHGRYFRALFLSPGDPSLRVFVDPIRATLAVSREGQISRWGEWGVWEGRLMSPKGIAALNESTIAISDIGTKLVSFFSRSGTYLGTLSDGSEWRRFLYALDLDIHGRALFAADFKDDAVYGFQLPEGLGPRYAAPETPDDLARTNLFRHPLVLSHAAETRCLNCHDGLETHSLLKFLKGRKHHPTGVEVPTPTRLPLEGGRMTCATCHTPHHVPHAGQQVSLAGEIRKTPKEPGMLRLPNQELCLSCHAEKKEHGTNHFGLSHRGWPLAALIRVQACSQCHQSHGGEAHLLHAATPQLCLQCHGSSRLPKGHPLGEKVDCLSCHSVHGANPALTFAHVAPGRGGVTCLGCHDKLAAELATNSHLLRVGARAGMKKKAHWHSAETSCLACHAPHARAKQAPQLCWSCHDNRQQVHRPLIAVAQTSRAEGVRLDGEKINCLTCHAVHGTVPQPGKLVPFCASCHGTGAETLFQNFHRRRNARRGARP